MSTRDLHEARAQAELNAAQRSVSVEAAKAHRDLAQLHLLRAGRLDQLVGTPGSR